MIPGLILDENLPARLGQILSQEGLSVTHVGEHGFDATSDQIIWDFAVNHGLVIVTKDSDYIDLAAISGNGRVVLIAVGNMRLKPLCDFVQNHAAMISEFAAGTNRVLVLGREPLSVHI